MTTTDTVLVVAADAFQQSVTAADTLFDLGADSLSTVEFALRLEQQLGSPVDPEWLMTGETLGELAATVLTRTQKS